jgi:hypothetical protein
MHGQFAHVAMRCSRSFAATMRLPCFEVAALAEARRRVTHAAHYSQTASRLSVLTLLTPRDSGAAIELVVIPCAVRCLTESWLVPLYQDLANGLRQA